MPIYLITLAHYWDDERDLALYNNDVSDGTSICVIIIQHISRMTNVQCHTESHELFRD